MYCRESWAAVVGLFLAFYLNVLRVQGPWVNDWDKPVDFTCGDFEFVRVIVSYHQDDKEDRRFFLQCGKLPISISTPTSTPICSWTEYLNDFHQDFMDTCNSTGYVAGMQSYYDNYQEDRRYKLYCCYMSGTRMFDCNTPEDYVNEYDSIAVDVVLDDKILNGMSSSYSSRGHDRRFKFIKCSMSWH